MKFLGLQKTTLLDYPGHVAATVFTGGCNFRCPFCQNGELVFPKETAEWMEEEEILEFLKKRKGILDGLCITGGEPTLQEGLMDFICEVKKLDYLVKLDTNGYRPDVLEALLKADLLDYVAMDIKGSPTKYPKACGLNALEFEKIQKSVALLKEGNIDYEFRTTVVKELHEEKDFEEIGRWLWGAPQYYLQCFRDSEFVLQKGLQAFSYEDLERMAGICRKYVPEVGIRGIDEG